MRNMHVIPTNKPSRIFFNAGELCLRNSMSFREGDKPQNICITSVEKPKAGDYSINVDNQLVQLNQSTCIFYDFKVILTTDQDLIKDGIQAIDDDFLQWFIKNPSCEEVEIRKEMYMPQSNGKISDGKITHEISLEPSQNTLPYYKIIIPKEEQKQHLIDIMRGDEELGLYEEPKQETLEEFIEREGYPEGHTQDIWETGVRDGIAWQEERMYSEEDLLSAFEAGMMFIGEDKGSFREWFEQFKNK